MSKVVDIDDFKPHRVSEVICVKCLRRWIAIRPCDFLLKELECPSGHIGFVIETGQDLEVKSAIIKKPSD